jgi:hypothetical protein
MTSWKLTISSLAPKAGEMNMPTYSSFIDTATISKLTPINLLEV